MLLKFSFFFLVITLHGCVSPDNQSICPDGIKVDVLNSGFLKSINGSAATEFIFLDDKNVLIATLPGPGKDKSKLQVYTKNGSLWSFNIDMSKNLPEVFHPRQMIKADIDGDKIDEVIISDHGIDKHPFPGSHTVILKKKNNLWVKGFDSEKLGITYNFNTAVLQDGDSLGLYKGKVFRPGDPFYFIFQEGRWIDRSQDIPREVDQLCYMTNVTADFDNNGSKDLFLGGCDLPEPQPEQVRDLIITKKNGSWSLIKTPGIPVRPKNSSWGTVFLKAFNFNNDNKIDLIVSTHDHGFHRWQVYILENSSKGEGDFSFKFVPMPIEQEDNTEGYVNSVENLELGKNEKAYLIEVRSVIRNEKFKHPVYGTKLVMQEEAKLTDISACLPDIIKREPFRMRSLPNNSSKALLIPYHGEIYELGLRKN